MNSIVELMREKREGYYADRIFAQLRFAKRLSEENGGQYDTIVQKATETLYAACGEEPIGKAAVLEAEAELEPLRAVAKAYKVICAAHAHIDMNWQWGWDETVGVVVDTVTTMLKLLEEYPEFHFSLSQASSYKILADHAPELLEQVKAYIREGRWEVTAPSWVECDKNMPSGESLSHQLLVAKTYLASLLDIPKDSMELDFEPDTFGHSQNVPEILSHAGVKYYYHCRGTDEPYTLYRWQSPSGAEILVNREQNFYSSPVNTDLGLVAIEVAKKQGIQTTLRVYGVGDHGGGPSRRDIEALLDMAAWPCFPNFVLGTYHDFFTEVEAYKDQLPVVKHEINFIFDGCYTAESRIKSQNKNCESVLYDAEAMTVMAKLLGQNAPKVKPESWQMFLTNHFHDIVTGSGVPATRDYALGSYQQILADAKNVRKLSARKIAQQIDTTALFPRTYAAEKSFGAGAGSPQAEAGMGIRRVFNVFNTLAHPVTRVVELMLWDWQGDAKRLTITDASGHPLPMQINKKGQYHYWGHEFLSALAEVTIPAFGYTTIIADEADYTDTKAVYWPEKHQQWAEEFVLENEMLRVTFDTMDGTICSVVDKTTQEELLSAPAGVFRLITEACNKEISGWTSEMSSWLVGRYKDMQKLHKNCELSTYHGAVRNGMTCTFRFGRSSIAFEAYLDKGSRMLQYQVNVDWQEVGSHENGVPQLSFAVPVQGDTCCFDVPYGVTARKAVGYDLPATSFAACGKLSIFSKDTYGYRFDKDTLALTVLRGSFEPDPYPETGCHLYQMAIGFDLPCCVKASEAYLHEPLVLSTAPHGGVLPQEASVLCVENAMLTSAELHDNALMLRVNNPGPADAQAKVTVSAPVAQAAKTNYFGEQAEAVSVDNGVITVALKPNSISTLKLEP